jgi:hypothetical protein
MIARTRKALVIIRIELVHYDFIAVTLRYATDSLRVDYNIALRNIQSLQARNV